MTRNFHANAEYRKKDFRTNLERKKGIKLQIKVPDQYQCFGSGLNQVSRSGSGSRRAFLKNFQFLIIKILDPDPDWHSAWNSASGINESGSETLTSTVAYLFSWSETSKEEKL
jgi:hypothetical protein